MQNRIDAFTSMIENRELVRKNSARRLHGTRPTRRNPPRAETPQDSALAATVCTHRHEIPSPGGDWLTVQVLSTTCENPRHERLHRDYATAYKRIMGMSGRYECGEYK
ncbi:MAG: hypothetical protein ACLR9W_05155 [Enterobacter hormaechei]